MHFGFCAEKFGEMRDQVSKGVFIGRTVFGAAEVAHEDDSTSIAKYLTDGRQCGGHAGIVGDLELLVERDVEVHPDEGFFPGEIEGGEAGHMMFIYGPT